MTVEPCARRHALTLVELLGVLGIISVLAGLSFTLFSSAQKSSLNYHVHAARARAKPSSLPRKSPPLTWKENEHIVIFKAGTKNAKAHARRLANLCGGRVLFDYEGAFLACALAIAEGALGNLTADPFVDIVEKNYISHYCVETIPTGVHRINIVLGSLGLDVNSPIHNILPGGNINVGVSTTPVAIMDSGIDNLHPDLHVVFSKGFGGQPDIGDGVGHGTHVPGIVGAIHNNFGVAGVAPGAPLWSIRVGDLNGIPVSNTLAAYQFMAANANQVRVINCSFGGAFISVAQNMAVTYCVSQGQVVCIASGNDAADSSGYSPASAPGGLCVAALADSDGLPGGVGPVTPDGPDDTFADFSNWGTPVAVIAPGVQILSTLPTTGSSLGTNYGVLSGTSMASPHAAGLAARILSSSSTKIRNIVSQGPNYSPAQVLNWMLQNSTENIPGIFDARTYPLINGRNANN